MDELITVVLAGIVSIRMDVIVVALWHVITVYKLGAHSHENRPIITIHLTHERYDSRRYIVNAHRDLFPTRYQAYLKSAWL